MTQKEALQAAVKYELSDNELEKILIDRGLTAADVYAGKSQAFDLAQADAITLLVTAPNVSEGGYSLSLSDKSSLIKIATGIYTKYGEVNPLIEPPKVTALNVW
jgi:hypothetical protein